METTNSSMAKEGGPKVSSISHALNILNDAAEGSADEIKGMLKSDYQNLRKMFDTIRPEVSEAMFEMKRASAESVEHAKEKLLASAKEIDETVHANAWYYVGGVAATSAFLGYLFAQRMNKRM